MTAEDLRQQFKKEAGIPWENSQGEPDIDYVMWLEQKLSQSLPEITDEEIFQRRKKIMSHHSHSGDYMSGWYDGAKWYRKQLKK